MDNEIKITFKINEEDLNKEIYFLDNYESKDIKGNIHYLKKIFLYIYPLFQF